MRTAILLVPVVAFACSSTEAKLGSFTVRWQESPAQFTVLDGASELLASSGAPVASRLSFPTWESQFGAYKLTEDDAPWHASSKLTADVTDGRVVLDFGDGRRVTITNPKGNELDLALEAPATDNRVKASFACAPSDHFLGFGSQADAVDHRGHRLAVWISEPGIGKTDKDEIPADDAGWMLHGTRHAASYPLPTFLSNRGGASAFLADTTRRTVFDLCQASADAWTVEAWDRQVTLKLFTGKSPPEVLRHLTDEIGRQPRANDLALAPWNDAIFGSEKVREIANLLRVEHIPSGALWTEDFRGGDLDGENYRLKEEWDVDRTLYPDVEKLAEELHGKGFRWFAYHNTFLNSGTEVLKQAQAAGVTLHDPQGEEYDFTGVKFTPSSLVDLTHPQGPAFVTSRLEKLLSYGFDGWMSDYGEWLPPDAKLSSGDAEALHNEYPRQYFAAVMEAMKAHPHPELSSVFVRSGSLRTAPLQPVVWAGDQWTNMLPDDGLPTVVTMGLNLGLGGVAVYGHDVAGYQNGSYGPSTKETFFRWTTVGALSPVMRTHHGTKAKSNWWFGKDAETIAHFRRWAGFHARLWPYLRAAADEAATTGLPIMRQLALAFSDDRAWTVKDEYLFGPSILVAPVMVEGATSRNVWLPAGSWMPFDGGAALSGGEVTVEVPLTEAAMFVRPGTILPMLPERLDTLMPADPPIVDLDDVRGERTLLAWAGAEGSWTDVDGSSYRLSHEGANGAAVDGVKAAEPLPACSGATKPCFTRDEARRTITVAGDHLSNVSFTAAGAPVATLATTGAVNVTEIRFHY